LGVSESLNPSVYS